MKILLGGFINNNHFVLARVRYFVVYLVNLGSFGPTVGNLANHVIFRFGRWRHMIVGGLGAKPRQG